MATGAMNQCSRASTGLGDLMITESVGAISEGVLSNAGDDDQRDDDRKRDRVTVKTRTRTSQTKGDCGDEDQRAPAGHRPPLRAFSRARTPGSLPVRFSTT